GAVGISGVSWGSGSRREEPAVANVRNSVAAMKKWMAGPASDGRRHRSRDAGGLVSRVDVMECSQSKRSRAFAPTTFLLVAGRRKTNEPRQNSSCVPPSSGIRRGKILWKQVFS